MATKRLAIDLFWLPYIWWLKTNSITIELMTKSFQLPILWQPNFLFPISWWSKKNSLVLWQSNPFSIMMCKGINPSVKEKKNILFNIKMNVHVIPNTKWVHHINSNNHVNFLLVLSLWPHIYTWTFRESKHPKWECN